MAELEPFDRIRSLPLWRGTPTIEPLVGGLTNRNYLVADLRGKSVVRLGGDIPIHGILRFNEHAASWAAAAAGISPAVRHAEPGMLVIDHIEGRTLSAADLRADRDRCTALVKHAHRQVAQHLRGPILAFNVFHILRDYIHRLNEEGHRLAADLPRLTDAATRLEHATGAIDLVFGHNDLLAANFLDDGTRLWLIDWDYAGFNTPLFDLGGLSSNNGFAEAEDEAMLEAYFERPPDDALRQKFSAMVAASLMREALWSMVSELHSDLDFDYVAYTAENLARYEAAWSRFRALESR